MIHAKKGQEVPTGTSAATLVGIITLLLVFYILFLPPAARESLLEEEKAGAEIEEEPMLLQAAIGKLEPVAQSEFERTLPNVYLQEMKSAKIITEINPFVVKKTLTSSEPKNMTFGISDIASAENVMLSFAAPKREGTLKITVNGYEVFEGAITQINPAPIPISKSYLKEINTLVFEITSFGLPSKQYEITDAKIIGDIADVMRLQATETLPIEEAEYNNLESAILQYYIGCDQWTTGNLQIRINDKAIFSGAPTCDSPWKIDLFQEDLKPGKNIVQFQLARGSINVEQMKFKAELKPTKAYSDFFTITASTYAAIKARDARAVLEIEFTDDGKTKEIQTNINGRLDIIEQKTPIFTKDISNAIVKGNNYIEITPLTEASIIRLEIRAE